MSMSGTCRKNNNNSKTACRININSNSCLHCPLQLAAYASSCSNKNQVASLEQQHEAHWKALCSTLFDMQLNSNACDVMDLLRVKYNNSAPSCPSILPQVMCAQFLQQSNMFLTKILLF